jgi:serine/threonine protein kinase
MTTTTTDPSTTTTTVGTCDNVSERYEKVGRVGQGTYGVVYKARDRFYNKKRSSSNTKDGGDGIDHNQDEEYVALKRCIPHHESSDGFPITTLREIHALRVCSQHPNVVSLLHVAVSSSTSSSAAALGGVFLVFEYCPQDLAQLIDAYYPKHKKSPFSEAQVKRLTLQLLSACDYLHSHSLLHRDIKLSNLLYTSQGQLKLADFGLSRHYYNDTTSSHGGGDGSSSSSSSLTPNVVSLWYRPPELLLGARSTTTTTTIKRLGKTDKPTGIITESPDRVSQPPPTSSTSITLHNSSNNNNSNSSTRLSPATEGVTSTITTTTTTYSSKIDLWAVGCVFGELLQGYPLLDGKDELDQVVKMIACLGWPPTSLYPEVSRNPKLVVSLHDSTTTTTTTSTSQQQQQQPLLDRFQYLSAEGLSLLTKLLDYNPDTRWSAQQALASSYFQQEPFPATHMPTFPSRHNV